MEKLEELPIPAPAYNGSKVTEMARIWLVDSNQITVVSPRLWRDPGAWGLMLVDLARQVAEVYEDGQITSKEEALRRIRLAFDAEWDFPT